MKNKNSVVRSFAFGLCLLWLLSCAGKEDQMVHSPDNVLSARVFVGEDGKAYYGINQADTLILQPGRLGVVMEDEDFSEGLRLDSVSAVELVKDDYELIHGKQKKHIYEANKRVFHLSNVNGRRMDVVFQVSNEGVGFRYYFPETSGQVKTISEEVTSFRFSDGVKAWMQPLANAKTSWGQCNPSYEEHYLQNIDAGTPSPFAAGWAFPTLFKNGETWILVSETGLDRNYCATRLRQHAPGNEYTIGFPQPEEVSHGGELNPQSTTPWYSPWRILAIGSLNTIVESTLGTDLATPAIDGDFSWVKPGRSSWSWVLLKDGRTVYDTQKQFIDYAADMGWEYCLIDALWDVQIGDEKIQELVDYGKKKNVGVWLWYNSSGDWNDTPQTPKSKLLTREDRMREFKKVKEMGVAGLKIDFFGGDGQSVIGYYHDILEDAAQTGLMINFHGCTLPRGWQRTYPHLLTMEAIKGMEFVTFEQANADAQANHCTVIPFTRNVFDPMDFTPTAFSEIFNIERKTTNAFELALPVLFYSGAQHYAEIPEGMATVPGYVKELMRQIPATWDETRLVDGMPGKYVVMARRSGETWYVAGINGEKEEKPLTITLPFVEKNKAVLVTDGEDNLSFTKVNLDFNAQKQVELSLKGNGGFLIKI